MFKVLDLAISDRNSVFCFAYLFIYFFLSVSVQLNRVEGCFDFFTARFH